MAASPGKITGTLAATGQSGELGPCKAVHISITGTWAGTVKAQRSLDGTNWVDLPNASWTANVQTQFQIGVRPIIFRLDWTRVSGSLVYTVEADDGESAAVAREPSTSDPVPTNHSTTGLGDGVKVVAVAGTDEALASSTAAKWVTIQAQTDNTSSVAIGATGVDATVATGDGISLDPGDVITIPCDNLADIFVDALVSGEGVRFIYGT